MVLSDCSGTYDQSLHDATMENIRRSFGVVASSDELVKAWQTRLAPAVA
jgi:nicotinamidase-related amidase